MMSIRLRFTLLYTFILAVTLAFFGFALHALQSRETLRSLIQDLSLGANRLAEALPESGFSSRFPQT